jgi:Dicer dimerisation domain
MLKTINFNQTLCIFIISENGKSKIVAKCVMPIGSKIKNIVIGEPQDNVRDAKKSAAFKACIALYECGDLCENLSPVSQRMKIEEHMQDYFSHWKKYGLNEKNAGQRKHQRLHEIKLPKAFENCGKNFGFKEIFKSIFAS